MNTRIGKVTQIYPGEGRVKVTYEDSGSSSLPLAMLTMNKEYSMPSVGDRVVTMHMENGSSKGFVLGTYYGGGMQPKASSGYRKDYTSGCYSSCSGGAYTLKGSTIKIKGSGASVSLGSNATVTGTNATLGSSSSDEETGEPDSYFKATPDNAEVKGMTDVKVEAEGGMMEIKSATEITVEATGGAVSVSANGGAAEVTLDTDTTIKASSITLEGDTVTLKCSYGTVTVEEIMKRLERIEDQLGLPHTI